MVRAVSVPQIVTDAPVEWPRKYAEEALEVIAGIMRNSDNEKTRLVAAAMLLEHGGDRRPKFLATGGDLPAIETRGSMVERITNYLCDHYMQSFDASELRVALLLKSPVEAINATLKQLHKVEAIGITSGGKYRALPPK